MQAVNKKLFNMVLGNENGDYMAFRLKESEAKTGQEIAAEMIDLVETSRLADMLKQKLLFVQSDTFIAQLNVSLIQKIKM